MRRLCLLYKVLSTKEPACIHDLIPPMGNFPEIQIHLTPLLEQNISRTHFSRVLSVIGISSIQIFVILVIIAYFANLIRAVETKPCHINDCWN